MLDILASVNDDVDQAVGFLLPLISADDVLDLGNEASEGDEVGRIVPVSPAELEQIAFVREKDGEKHNKTTLESLKQLSATSSRMSTYRLRQLRGFHIDVYTYFRPMKIIATVFSTE